MDLARSSPAASRVYVHGYLAGVRLGDSTLIQSRTYWWCLLIKAHEPGIIFTQGNVAECGIVQIADDLARNFKLFAINLEGLVGRGHEVRTRQNSFGIFV